MAARLRHGTLDKPWDQKVRTKIQTSMLVNRLTDHVKGLCELSSTQVQAALGLLRKTLPDLATMEIQTGDGGPVLIVTGIMRPEPAVIEAQPTSIAIEEAKPLMDKVELPTKDEPS